MAKKIKRVLVAGGTGYLGGNVVKELVKRGYFVRVLARSPEKLADLKDKVDEIVEGDVTDPESLIGCCDGIDVVFSSVGITKQKGKLSWQDVDYRGNCNLLSAAKKSGVRKFVYVSVVNGPKYRHLDMVKAHEDFVDELKGSGIPYAIIRPTGFFSDIEAFFSMARRGRVYLIGKGDNHINPIHGADLAVACAEAIENGTGDIEIGGPDILTYEEIGKLAFSALGKPAKISSMPLWLAKAVIAVTRVFSRHTAGLIAFFTSSMTSDQVAPVSGSHTLKAHFAKCAEVEAKK